MQSWMPGWGYEVKDMCMVTQRSDALFIAASKGEDRERATKGTSAEHGPPNYECTEGCIEAGGRVDEDAKELKCACIAEFVRQA